MPEAQSQHHQDTRQTEAGPSRRARHTQPIPRNALLRPREKLATWELVKPGIKGNSPTSKGLASHPILPSHCRVTCHPSHCGCPLGRSGVQPRGSDFSAQGPPGQNQPVDQDRSSSQGSGEIPHPAHSGYQQTHSPQTETSSSWAAAAPSSTQSRRPPLSFAHFTYDFCLFFVVCCFLLKPK